MNKVLSDIWNGYKNYFIKDEVVEEIAKKRAEICAACDFKKKGLHAAVLPDVTLGKVQGYYCTKCAKCPISVKVRSEHHECPENKW